MKQEGFKYLEEKGLFTFYKEQEESEKKRNLSPIRINLRRQQSNDSSDNKNHPSRTINNQIQALRRNVIVMNDKKDEQSPQIPNMNVSHSGKISEFKTKTIVQLSLQSMSARRQVYKQVQYIRKGRAKTEASQVQIKPQPSPPRKLQQKSQVKGYEQLRNNYFSQKIYSPKKSSIFFRLKKADTFSKITKKNMHFLTTQPSEVINENLVVKGVQDKDYQQKKLSIQIRKAQLLPQLKSDKEKRSSIDFWQYFQERKIFFINRYKKAKVNKMREKLGKEKKNNA